MGLKRFLFEGKHVVFKDQGADFFEVSSRTIDNYIAKNEQELAENGYEVVRGKRLLLLKEVI